MPSTQLSNRVQHQQHIDAEYQIPGRKPSGFHRMMTGVMAFALGVFICGAYGSHSPTDPSLNVASDAETSNLFGSTGAVAADLLMQSFGWTAWLAGFGLMIGGVYRTFGIGPRRPSRWFWGMMAISMTCICLAGWPIPSNWPLATGLGGMAGERLNHFASIPFAAFGAPDPVLLASITTGIAGVLFAAIAMGLGADDGIAVFRTIGQMWNSFKRGKAIPMEVVTEHDEAEIRDVAGLRDRANSFFENMRSRNPQQAALPDPEKMEPHLEDNFLRNIENSERPTIPVRQRLAEKVVETQPASSIIEETTPKSTLFGNRASQPNTDMPAKAPAPAPVSVKPVRAPQPATPQSSISAPILNDGSRLPPIDLLQLPPERRSDHDETKLLEMAELLQVVLGDFGVKGRISEVRPGPVVTLFEFEPAPGTKSSRVISLAEDIARSMSATAARVAVVPGRNAIGIELPNDDRETVYFRDLLSSKAFTRSRASLPLALGENIGGESTVADLAKMPHLLIAGTTGSGKSVGINAMILSLLYKLTPEECRFIMIDPKMLELSIYEGIPHLLSPVVIDPNKAVAALKWTVREMESRYEVMSKMGVRNISGFNKKASEARESGETYTRPIQTGYNSDTGEPIWENEIIDMRPMPHIVVVIDEMADLMIVAGKEIEALIQRLAQMARAAGIHLITATQRPSVDVITGTIKANFPTRISYMVTTKIDSRTILGEQGAEQLLGMGDLLYQASGGKLNRVHGPFVSDEEVEAVVNFLKDTGEPSYVEGLTDEPEEDVSVADAAMGVSSGDVEEDLYREAIQIVRRDKRASTSYIQRKLRIGYNRAASLIERMESEGLVSAANHAGKREILMPEDNAA
ncbi:DNA translocase FtsK [Hirschia baltica]|uniref:DNA translocase FtsK n=1 Tax=Hirschia baltica (strain ATCC 49814 / DSM 5838 / IFAM 1418) TaxID=582402 RepID=C6XKC1_HIRBI|nr:DNA translocase FtsK [Hirschia baltica]ACT57719.1 cell divisionFtsK/SpoIIIE [Hirschia baltica ATCC 49814]